MEGVPSFIGEWSGKCEECRLKVSEAAKVWEGGKKILLKCKAARENNFDKNENDGRRCRKV